MIIPGYGDAVPIMRMLSDECLSASRVKAGLQMRLNETDENDAEGLAQIMRTGYILDV